jgi:hypothetical protein
VLGGCEHGNELLDAMKYGGFLNLLKPSGNFTYHQV